MGGGGATSHHHVEKVGHPSPKFYLCFINTSVQWRGRSIHVQTTWVRAQCVPLLISPQFSKKSLLLAYFLQKLLCTRGTALGWWADGQQFDFKSTSALLSLKKNVVYGHCPATLPLTIHKITLLPILTPSLPQPVKFPGWKMQGYACKQYVFRSNNFCFHCFNALRFCDYPFTCQYNKK